MAEEFLNELEETIFQSTFCSHFRVYTKDRGQKKTEKNVGSDKFENLTFSNKFPQIFLLF